MKTSSHILYRPAMLYVLPQFVLGIVIAAATVLDGESPRFAAAIMIFMSFTTAIMLLLLWASLQEIGDTLKVLQRRAIAARWPIAEPTLPFSVSRWRTPCSAASWTIVVDGQEVFVDVMLALGSTTPGRFRRRGGYRAYLRAGIRVRPSIPNFDLWPRYDLLDTPLFGSMRSVRLQQDTQSTDWLCTPPDVAALLAKAPPSVSAVFNLDQPQTRWSCASGLLWLEHSLNEKHEDPSDLAKRLRVVAEYLEENRPFRPNHGSE